MTVAEVLVDSFARIREVVHDVVVGLTPQQLTVRPDGHGNSIAWLVWHLTRVQDDHIAGASQSEQVWTSQGWLERFALPFARVATGYGQRVEEVAILRVESGDLLTGYHDAVYEQTARYVRELADVDLDRVVDESWRPVVTLGVRLVSVIADDLQHAGQAAYVRGLVERQ